MAGLRSRKTIPIGSAAWIINERSSALQFVQEEVDEFTFAALNEVEWLNEHMADVFSNNQKSITEIFKTPGKLRGKTPRTIRKRNPLEARAPLTDIFAPNLKAAPAVQPEPICSPIRQATVLIEPAKQTAATPSAGKRAGPVRSGKENADSGYHGITDDERESGTQHTFSQEVTIGAFPSIPPTNSQETIPFVISERDLSPERETPHQHPQRPQERDVNPASDAPHHTPDAARVSQPESRSNDEDIQHHGQESDGVGTIVVDPGQDRANETFPGSTTPLTEPVISTASDGQQLQLSLAPSTPHNPAKTAGSLSFLASPSKEAQTPEPAAGRKGTSNVHHDDASPARDTAVVGNLRSPHGAVNTGEAHSPVSAKQPAAAIQAVIVDERPSSLNTGSEDQLTPRRQRKISTQTLIGRIASLGRQPQPARRTRSIQQFSRQTLQTENTADIVNQDDAGSLHPEEAGEELPAKNVDGTQHLPTSTQVADADDIVGGSASAPDEIPSLKAPLINGGNVVAMQHSAEPTPLPTSPIVEARNSDDLPMLPTAPLSSFGLPVDRAERPAAALPFTQPSADGLLSATKAKLSSALKNAKGKYASSAGLSAQAKMEIFAPSPMQLRSRGNDDKEVEPEPAALQIAAPAPVPEQEEPKDANAQPAQSQHLQSEPDQGKPSKRPIRLPKAAQTKPKPAPAAKFGTASQRQVDGRKVNPPNSALAASLQQTLAPAQAAAAKQPPAQAKPSTASLRKVASNASIRSAATNAAKPKPLTAAAARKKAQDEREARKQEAKREAERRKAAAQQEEERRKEDQRREMESARQRGQAAQAEDPKKAAQRQAIERRRIENARKQELQRSANAQSRLKASGLDIGGSSATSGRTADVHARQEAGVRLEKAPVHNAAPRGELNNARAASKLAAANGTRGLPEERTWSFAQPPVNPARPPKRPAQPDANEDRDAGPTIKVGPSYVQIDAKRRHTGDEDESGPSQQLKSLRQPNAQNEALSKAIMPPPYVADGPMSQPEAAPTDGFATSLSTTPQQPPQPAHFQAYRTIQGVDMNKFATAKIPFAETNGNSALAGYVAPSGIPKGLAATPIARSAAAGSAQPSTARKATSHYREGDSIELPSIPSEEDSPEDVTTRRFAEPYWAHTPELQPALERQQLVDPEQVFGPIAPLDMAEIFRGNKDRMQRFRNRTSSANWNGQDRLTQEEIQRDLELRQRLIANGEWTYGLV